MSTKKIKLLREQINTLPEHISKIIYNDYLLFDNIQLIFDSNEENVQHTIRIFYAERYYKYKKEFICGIDGELVYDMDIEGLVYTILSEEESYEDDKYPHLMKKTLLQEFPQRMKNTLTRSILVDRLEVNQIIRIFTGNVYYEHLILSLDSRDFWIQPIYIECSCNKKALDKCECDTVTYRRKQTKSIPVSRFYYNGVVSIKILKVNM